MKARIIRGISKLPVRRVGLMTKHLGECALGKMPVTCALCQKKVLLTFDKHQNIRCPECENCELELSKLDFIAGQSAIRIEKWASALVFKINVMTVMDWCKDNINNQGWRLYLNLDNHYLEPRLGNQRVSSRTYWNMLRYVMFNIVATDAVHLRFLHRQKVDLTGLEYLHTAPGFNQTFTNSMGPYSQHGPRLDDHTRRMFATPEFRRQPAISTEELEAIFRIYGATADIFGTDNDENP